MDTRKAIILKTVNFCLKCLDSITNWLGLCWKTIHSVPLRVMNGIFFGVQAVVKVTCTKASTNIKRLIISHRATKSQGKIDFASIWSECKKGMESSILILSQILTSYQTSLVNSMNTTKSLSSTTVRKISGLSSLQTLLKVKALSLLTTSMM